MVYSGFVKVSYVTCTECECREVNEVKWGFNTERNMTDMKERETNKDKQGLQTFAVTFTFR